MASPNQSEKETIGIELPLPLPESPPDVNIKPHETAQIKLPVREPTGKTRRSIPVPAPIPAPVAHAPDSSGLRKETVRVSDMPDSPAAQMEKAEPPVAMPEVAVQDPSIPLAPAKKNSMLLMWILLGISALILIIQIWIYFS